MRRDYLACDDEYEGGVDPEIDRPRHEERETIVSMFDLEKCMADGGKCLAGDRPARVICTDKQGSYPVVALVQYHNHENAEEFRLDGVNAARESGLPGGDVGDLRNLPEYKEVEVTLWASEDGSFSVRQPGDGDLPSHWKPYGPPVPVRFPKGD